MSCCEIEDVDNCCELEMSINCREPGGDLSLLLFCWGCGEDRLGDSETRWVRWSFPPSRQTVIQKCQIGKCQWHFQNLIY